MHIKRLIFASTVVASRTLLTRAVIAWLMLFTISVPVRVVAGQPTPAVTGHPTLYKTVKVKGLDIFYREAGSPKTPTLLLLHGFPTSSHMFRNLIPALADKYHIIAPDYPGYGHSSMPSVTEFISNENQPA